MDRNEAIEHLKVVLKTCDVQDEEAVEMAIKSLGGKDIDVPIKWIPVSERLPEESGVYYVTEKVYAVMDERRKGKYILVADSATYDINKKQWLRAKFLEVVAWMERTPWEGEQNGQTG